MTTVFTPEITRLLSDVAELATNDVELDSMKKTLSSWGWVNTPLEEQTEECIEMCHALQEMEGVRMWIKVYPYCGVHKIAVGLDEVTAHQPKGHGIAVLFQRE